jgi:hypothetical protein
MRSRQPIRVDGAADTWSETQQQVVGEHITRTEPVNPPVEMLLEAPRGHDPTLTRRIIRRSRSRRTQPGISRGSAGKLADSSATRLAA